MSLAWWTIRFMSVVCRRCFFFTLLSWRWGVEEASTPTFVGYRYAVPENKINRAHRSSSFRLPFHTTDSNIIYTDSEPPTAFCNAGGAASTPRTLWNSLILSVGLHGGYRSGHGVSGDVWWGSLLTSPLEKLFGLGSADSVSLSSVSFVTCCTENECYARGQ